MTQRAREGTVHICSQLTCLSPTIPTIPSSRTDCDKNNRDNIIINIADFNEMPTPPNIASRPNRELTRCFMILLHLVLTFAMVSVRNRQQLYPDAADLLPDFLTFCHIAMTVTGWVDKAMEPCTNEQIGRDVNLTKDLLWMNVFLFPFLRELYPNVSLDCFAWAMKW
ncbi:hypothetical protein BC567DRAFT_249768 [Phyllosticta citribraziliensis]